MVFDGDILYSLTVCLCVDGQTTIRGIKHLALCILGTGESIPIYCNTEVINLPVDFYDTITKAGVNFRNVSLKVVFGYSK